MESAEVASQGRLRAPPHPSLASIHEDERPSVGSNRSLGFSAPWRLAGFYGVVALLHVLGWTLYLQYAASHSALVGLGLAAYLLGLRHAFDADHIAAVDDTIRYLLQKGQRPLGVGFFFSLGHSTIVLLLALGIAYAAVAVQTHLPGVKGAGSLIGAGISGSFLRIIGVLNLVVLLQILAVWHPIQRGAHSHARIERLLQQRGLLNRLFGGRFRRVINHSGQMYLLGLLFGLGFDTASEIGLLVMTAGASTGDLPIGGILSLPILFGAGMSVMDTADGVLMTKAYDWALRDPARKVFYNVATTSVSVVVALGIGTVELLRVATHLFDLNGAFFDAVREYDFGQLGYLIVGLFLAGWALSVVAWRLGRFGQRTAVSRHCTSSFKSTA